MNDRTAPVSPSADRSSGRRAPSSPGRWRPPAHRVRFCKLSSCQPDAGAELAAALEARLGIDVDERTADNAISLEALECIGLCDIPQAVTVDELPVIGLESVLKAVDDLLETAAPEGQGEPTDQGA